MSITRAIRRLLGRDATQATFSPSALRNKPGGMAWIKGIGNSDGTEQINGRAVRVVCITSGRIWAIDPPQQFTCTSDTHYTRQDVIIRAGQTYSVDGVADENLEPWKDVGDDDQDESLSYLPPVPASLSNIVKERL
jgi:hypothetical protein